MIYVNVRQSVADYTKWRADFNTNVGVRKGAGATGVEQVYCDLDNPNDVNIILEWDSIENARIFFSDPKQAEVLKKAGVIGTADVHFLDCYEGFGS